MNLTEIRGKIRKLETEYDRIESQKADHEIAAYELELKCDQINNKLYQLKRKYKPGDPHKEIDVLTAELEDKEYEIKRHDTKADILHRQILTLITELYQLRLQLREKMDALDTYT